MSVHSTAPTTSAAWHRAGAALPCPASPKPQPLGHTGSIHHLKAKPFPGPLPRQILKPGKGVSPLSVGLRFRWLGAWGVRLLATSLMHQELQPFPCHGSIFKHDLASCTWHGETQVCAGVGLHHQNGRRDRWTPWCFIIPFPLPWTTNFNINLFSPY